MQSFLAHRLFAELLSLRLPTDDYAIAGSGPLFVRGWIDDPTDLDIVARGAAWRIAAGRGPIEGAPYSSSQRVQLFDGDLDILDGWFPEMWSADELIKDADIFEGLRFVALGVVAATKLMIGRERDLAHVDVLRAHGFPVP
jgi:hypothetical protein